MLGSHELDHDIDRIPGCFGYIALTLSLVASVMKLAVHEKPHPSRLVHDHSSVLHLNNQRSHPLYVQASGHLSRKKACSPIRSSLFLTSEDQYR